MNKTVHSPVRNKSSPWNHFRIKFSNSHQKIDLHALIEHVITGPCGIWWQRDIADNAVAANLWRFLWLLRMLDDAIQPLSHDDSISLIGRGEYCKVISVCFPSAVTLLVLTVFSSDVFLLLQKQQQQQVMQVTMSQWPENEWPWPGCGRWPSRSSCNSGVAQRSLAIIAAFSVIIVMNGITLYVANLRYSNGPYMK